MAEMEPKKSNIVPFAFYVADASATSQAATAMSATGEATATDVPQQPCPWAGSIVGLSIQTEAARTAGTLTIQPAINGTAAAASDTINATDTQYATTAWNRGQYTVTAGQRIGCLWSSSAAWAAGTTPSVRAVVYVHVESN